LLTLNAGDELDGGAGTDTLNAEVNADIADTTKIANIENINVTAYGARAIDMTNITKAVTITSLNSSGALTFNKVGDATTGYAAKGGPSTTLTANYAAGALDGANDTFNIGMTDAKSSSFTASAGFESVKIASSGASQLSTLSVPGVSTVTVTGSGTLDATTALSGFQTVTASGFTGNLTTGTVTSGYAGSVITGDATNGTTLILGSGNDNVGFTSAGAKTSTVLAGAGDDTLIINAAGAGAVTVQAQAGNDTIRLVTTALDANDLIDGGDGTDTVNIKGAVAQVLVMKDVEALSLESDATAAISITSNNKALAVTAKADNGNAVNLAGLTAGSTVTVDASSTATTKTVGAVSVGFTATEAASTIKLNSGVTGAITTSKIGAVTLDIGAASVLAGAITSTDTATALTVNATGSLTGAQAIASTDNKLATVNVTGSAAVDLGALTSTGLATTSITAATNLNVGAQSTSTKLNSVTLKATAGTLDYAALGSATTTKLDTVNLTAGTTLGATTAGAIDALAIGGITATAGTSLKVGALATAVAAQTVGNISLTGGTTVTVGAIGNSTDDVFSNFTATAGKGLLEVGAILGKTWGTISETATAGGLKSGNITTTDTTGITVEQSATTFINSTGATGGAATAIQNTGGNITASLTGAAAATVDYTGVTGLVNLNATNTGGLASTIVNGGTAGAGTVSTITLGNAVSSASNTVKLDGTVDTLNVTGGSGKDNIEFVTTNAFKGGTISLGSGTDSIDFTNLQGAGESIAAADGIAINLSNTAVAFDAGQSYASSLAAGHASQYQTATATSKAIVASGVDFTVSGVESVTGTAGADYIVAANTGTTIAGGVGNDKLFAGAGQDTFVYTTAAHSNAVTAAVMDTIDGLVINAALGDLLDFTLTGTVTFITAASGAANIAASDTTAEITGLFNSTNGTAGAGKIFTAGTNATAILATHTDGSKQLVVDVNGDGAFTVADVAIVLTNATVTSFAAGFLA
jgi:hypothetical protein